MKTIRTMILGMAAVSFFSACSSDATKKKEETPVGVKVYSPAKLTADGLFVSGMVSARQTAIISTRNMGFVDKIYVKQGDRVTAGQLLIIVNSDDLKAKKAQAEAMVIEAEAAAKNAARDYERFKKLHSQKSVSVKELENIELNKTSIDAKKQMALQSLNEVKSMLAYTHIKAPFSGVVTQKKIDEGSMASPGMPLLVVEQSGEMDVQATVPENYVQYLNVGDSVKVDIKSLGRRIEGKISELSPSASLTGGQYAMKVAISAKDKANLRSGMYAGIFIPGKGNGESLRNILINESSVIRREQLTGVYVVGSDNHAVLRWVRLGKKMGEQIEVLSGLDENDRIIENVTGELYNGKSITVLK